MRVRIDWLTGDNHGGVRTQPVTTATGLTAAGSPGAAVSPTAKGFGRGYDTAEVDRTIARCAESVERLSSELVTAQDDGRRIAGQAGTGELRRRHRTCGQCADHRPGDRGQDPRAGRPAAGAGGHRASARAGAGPRGRRRMLQRQRAPGQAGRPTTATRRVGRPRAGDRPADAGRRRAQQEIDREAVHLQSLEDAAGPARGGDRRHPRPRRRAVRPGPPAGRAGRLGTPARRWRGSQPGRPARRRAVDVVCDIAGRPADRGRNPTWPGDRRAVERSCRPRPKSEERQT